MKSRVLYTQAVIKNQEAVLRWFEKETGLNPEKMGWDVYCHHMTIEFFVKKDKKDLKRKGLPQSLLLESLSDLIGKDTALDIIGYAVDERGMALLVEPRGRLGLHIKNNNPHITIATNGVPPKYSNELLENKSVVISASGTVDVKVGWKSPDGKDNFSLPGDYDPTLAL